jgi:hypothetical protein
MRIRRAVAHGLTVRRLALVLVLSAAVVVMHVLSTSDTSHHSPLGVMSAMTPMTDELHDAASGRGDAPRQATPEPAGHLMSMTICAFAVLVAARFLLRSLGPRRSTTVPAPEPAIRLVAGPEPPVPRFAV